MISNNFTEDWAHVNCQEMNTNKRQQFDPVGISDVPLNDYTVLSGFTFPSTGGKPLKPGKFLYLFSAV